MTEIIPNMVYIYNTKNPPLSIENCILVNLLTEKEMDSSATTTATSSSSSSSSSISHPLHSRKPIPFISTAKVVKKCVDLLLTPIQNRNQCPPKLCILGKSGKGKSVMIATAIIFEILSRLEFPVELTTKFGENIDSILTYITGKIGTIRILESSLQRLFLSEFAGENRIFFYNEKQLHGQFSNFFEGSKKFPMDLSSLPFSFDDSIDIGADSDTSVGADDNVEYKSTEHWFQAQKFLYEGAPPQNINYAKLILAAITPNIAANMGRQRPSGQWASKWKVGTVEDIPSAYRSRNYHLKGGYVSAIKDSLKDGVVMRPDWDEVKNNVMRMALSVKFNSRYNSELSLSLQNLLSSNKTLREYAFPGKDNYWATFHTDGGIGFLGILLEEFREE